MTRVVDCVTPGHKFRKKIPHSNNLMSEFVRKVKTAQVLVKILICGDFFLKSVRPRWLNVKVEKTMLYMGHCFCTG